jgi:transcriptional regulator with XRE-family HTH domain
MAVGDRIRVLREEKGWTQNHLSKITGVPQPTIWRLEKGEITSPKIDLLKKIALALGVSIDVLTGGAMPTSPDETEEEDLMPEVVFRGYEKLSRSRRQQLLDFLRFLERQESDEEGGMKQ